MFRPSFLHNRIFFSGVFVGVKAHCATILVFVATLGLAAAACAFPRGDHTPEGRSVSDLPEDYLWVDYNHLREGRSWVGVTLTGHALYVERGAPGTKQIDAVKVGTLSTSQTEQIFDHLQRIEFFRLKDAVPSDVVEADILNVAAHVDGRHHQVSARPPTAVPEGLMGLVDSLKSVVPSLDSVWGDRLLLRAQKVSPDRAQELRDSGALQVSSEASSQHSFLQPVVHRPGHFVLLDDEEASVLREKVDGAPYFLVSTDRRTVAIELYSLTSTE